ncbi:hypothetical protein H7H80_00200 [Mycobacterium interjectum]|nr:hypothetical protein [Mycobacterium interjectum]
MITSFHAPDNVGNPIVVVEGSVFCHRYGSYRTQEGAWIIAPDMADTRGTTKGSK